MKTTSAILVSVGALAAAVLPVAAQPADIRQGLVAYWPMEAHDGATTLDATPFANNLSLSGAPGISPGRHGNAFTFDGGSTYLINSHTADNIPTGLPVYGAGTYTIAMWVKGTAQTARYLFSHGSTTVNTPIFILQTGQVAANNARFDVIIRNDANATLLNHVVSTNVVFDDNWHHIAWVDDRGSVRLYIDGVQDPANFNYTPSGTFTFLNTVVGSLVRTTVSTGAIFNGQMDDIAVWERALTQAEVQQVMNNSLTTPVPAFPPFIDRQPASVIANIGDRVTLSVRAVGNRPLNYQWFSNTVEVAGATAASLVLSNLTVADSADYTVSVSNIEGSTTSSIATVTVQPDPPSDLRRGMVSYWPLDELVDEFPLLLSPDLYSRNDFTMGNMTGANLVFGQFDNAVLFDGASQYAQRTGGGFPIYNNPAYSVALWVNINGTGQTDRRFFAESSTNSGNPLFVFGTHSTGANGTIRVFIRNDANAVLLDRATAGAPLDGTWHHIVWTETNGQARLYIDGQMDATNFNYTRGTLTLNQTALGAIIRALVELHCAGMIDEVAVWNRVLSHTEIQEIRTTGIPAPIMAIPPAITQQPSGQSVLTGVRVSFSFVATGTSPLFAQWRKGGTDLLDETNTTLVLDDVALTDAGDYDVVVSNSAGSVTSLVATLTVTLRPPPPASLQVDFNNTGADNNPANTESGFSPFAIPAIGTGPFTTSYGGADVTLTAIGTTMESRKRTTPVNAGLFTEERLLQDFVFTRDATADQGLDIAVEFMEPSTPYRVSIWSFDTGSTGNNRSSDWTANGMLVNSGWSFIGSTLPTDNNTYRFDFDTVSDSDGTIFIQGRRSGGAAGAINVFVNALKVVRRDLRIQKIEVLDGLDVVLTVELLNPGAFHRVEYKNRLDDTEWIDDPLAFFFPPNGNIVEVYVSVPDTATRFYQIVQEP
jgi:hypothetical protein